MAKSKRIKDILSYLQEDVPETEPGTDEPVDVNGSAFVTPEDEGVMQDLEEEGRVWLSPAEEARRKKKRPPV